MDRIAELTEQIKARAEDARRIAEKAEKDGWTAEDTQAVKSYLEQVETLKADRDRQKEGDSFARQLAELGASLPGEGTAASTAGRPARQARGATLGAAFVGSDEYTAFRSQWPGGRIPDRTRVNMAPVNLATITGKSDPPPDPEPGVGGEGGLISITGTPGAQGLVPPDWQGLVDTLGRYDVHLRQLISRRTTTSDLIEYVRQLTRVNAADWVPEATDLDPASFPSGETGVKPMGGFDLEVVTAPVDTVAEWIPITKRAAMDAGQLRGLIDDELRGDIADAEERAFLYGGGDNGQIEGLDQTSGVQEQDFDTDLFTTTRKAKSKVIYGGFAQPTAFLLNVEDDEAIDLERDGQGRFFGNGPFSVGPNTLWGLPRIASPYVEEGTAWLGDWQRAVVWDRQQAAISVSDSHADFFIRNLLAVLGEQREAFGVIRPAAFVKIATAS